ncbi:hypothetical protein HDU98_008817 [Podochytrium sp. JEL0797]|nr:hypothetical protein HDU98_008817 [Podochytrium sp. JEL0797]
MNFDWSSGTALKVYQRVMKSKSTSDGLKQMFRAKVRMVELTTLLCNLYDMSLDLLKKGGKLSWWPTRLPWSPLEQAEFFLRMRLLCASGRPEVVEWVLECQFSIHLPGMTPGSVDHHGDTVLFLICDRNFAKSPSLEERAQFARVFRKFVESAASVDVLNSSGLSLVELICRNANVV